MSAQYAFATAPNQAFVPQDAPAGMNVKIYYLYFSTNFVFNFSCVGMYYKIYFRFVDDAAVHQASSLHALHGDAQIPVSIIPYKEEIARKYIRNVSKPDTHFF